SWMHFINSNCTDFIKSSLVHDYLLLCDVYLFKSASISAFSFSLSLSCFTCFLRLADSFCFCSRSLNQSGITSFEYVFRWLVCLAWRTFCSRLANSIASRAVLSRARDQWLAIFSM